MILLSILATRTNCIPCQSSYPVPLTVTDIRPAAGHKTDPELAANYLKSQGVNMVFALDFTTNIFHEFAEYLYGNNMQEQQNWEPGKYFLSSLNFGGLTNSDSFQVCHNQSISVYSFLFRTFSLTIRPSELGGQTFWSSPAMAVTTASG